MVLYFTHEEPGQISSPYLCNVFFTYSEQDVLFRYAVSDDNIQRVYQALIKRKQQFAVALTIGWRCAKLC